MPKKLFLLVLAGLKYGWNSLSKKEQNVWRPRIIKFVFTVVGIGVLAYIRDPLGTLFSFLGFALRVSIIPLIFWGLLLGLGYWRKKGKPLPSRARIWGIVTSVFAYINNLRVRLWTWLKSLRR